MNILFRFSGLELVDFLSEDNRENRIVMSLCRNILYVWIIRGIIVKRLFSRKYFVCDTKTRFFVSFGFGGKIEYNKASWKYFDICSEMSHTHRVYFFSVLGSMYNFISYLWTWSDRIQIWKKSVMMAYIISVWRRRIFID